MECRLSQLLFWHLCWDQCSLTKNSKHLTIVDGTFLFLLLLTTAYLHVYLTDTNKCRKPGFSRNWWQHQHQRLLSMFSLHNVPRQRLSQCSLPFFCDLPSNHHPVLEYLQTSASPFPFKYLQTSDASPFPFNYLEMFMQNLFICIVVT